MRSEERPTVQAPEPQFSRVVYLNGGTLTVDVYDDFNPLYAGERERLLLNRIVDAIQHYEAPSDDA